MLSDRDYYISYSILALIYGIGLFVPLMNNDSAHHANIALYMHLTNDYVSLIDHGTPYLDKPHLHFWLVALSYNIFGVCTFAYKFPSLLFGILSLYATFRLGAILYSKPVGKLAALILATALAFVLAHNDVRMDIILTASILFAIWQLVEYTRTDAWTNLILGSLGLALGFSTKGMIGIVMPSISIFFFLLHQRNWEKMFYWKWLLVPVLVFVFISPVLYCYYLQFDLHPELVVRGRSNIQGVKFILWSQNLERLEGSSFGSSGKRDPFFFAHTFLWAFLPWSLLAFAAYWKKTKQIIQKRFRYRSDREGLTWSTITVIFIIISASGFKLPHYLTILFPLFSILTAGYLLRPSRKKRLKELLNTQIPVSGIILVFAFFLNIFIFPVSRISIALLSFSILIAGVYFFFQKKDTLRRLVVVSVYISMFNYILLNGNFYPQLLTFQAGNTLADYAQTDLKSHNDIRYLAGFEHSNSFDFYMGTLIDPVNPARLLRAGNGSIVYTGEGGKRELEDKNISFTVLHQAPDFRVTRLTLDFLKPKTRTSTLENHYLLEIRE